MRRELNQPRPEAPLLFGRPFVKRFALCYQTVVCSVCLSCPVCNVGVLWPNGCMDQDKLGIQVGLGPGHIVSDGYPAPCPHTGTAPLNFRPIYLLWPNGWIDQDATWYERRPGPKPHCARWGTSSPPQKGAQLPNFGPCLLWPNGWVDQDATLYDGRPRPGQHCV